jgi:hypothetical protein
VLLVEPVRTGLLRGFFALDDPRTERFVVQTLPIALALPLLMSVRATCRGLLMRANRTAWVTITTFAALAALVAASAAGPSAARENGAIVGYVCWMGSMLVETIGLLYAVGRVGVAVCVSEGRTGRLVPDGD